MPYVSEPLPSEADALVRLVQGIVLAQGNEFIKEMLRDRGIRIGSTKADFERNMLEAIHAGDLRREHIELWLNEVEGWGNQHVYLYDVPSDLSTALRDDEALRKKVLKAGFQKQYNAGISLEYPPQRTLTRIDHNGGELSFVWHQGKESAIRKKEHDFRNEIGRDVYDFRAYRIRSERAVTRFVVRPSDNVAAIFIQTPWNEEEHDEVISDVTTVVARVIPFDDLRPFAIATAIKKLDAISLNSRGVVAHATRLSSSGAYIEFGSTSARLGYQDVGPVREVRQAVKPRSFVGLNGNFMLPCADRNGDTRSVRVQLIGEQRRLRLGHQMTASEVWSIVDLVRENL